MQCISKLSLIFIHAESGLIRSLFLLNIYNDLYNIEIDIKVKYLVLVFVLVFIFENKEH